MAKAVSSLIVLKDEQLLIGSENYQQWSFLMEGVLFNDGLWNITQKGVTAADAAAKLAEEGLSKTAMYKIVFNCQPQVQSIVNTAKDGKVVWDRLKELYGKSTNTSMIGPLQKLFQVRLEDYSNVEAYLTDIMSNQSKLTQMGHGLNDVHLAHLMLIGLPIQYQPLRMTLESLNQDLTSDYVRQKIQSFQMETSGNSAMLSKTKGHSGQRAQDAPSNGKSGGRSCYHCGDSGHIKPKCKKWKAEKRKQKEKKQTEKKSFKDNDKANLAASSESDDDRCLLSIVADCIEAALHVNEGKPWYVDSGATKHMTSEEGLHAALREVNQKIAVANGQSTPAKGIGDIELNVDVGRTVIKDVLLVPGLSTNLVSVAAMCDKGMRVTFDNPGCCVTNKKTGKLLLTASRVGGLFQVNFGNNKSSECCKLQALAVKVSPSNQDLWHRRFGHLSLTQMKQVHGKDCSIGSLENRECEVCIRGKMVRRPFPPSKSERSKEPLQLIHTDLFGPMKLYSFGGARYVMLLQDDYSRKIFCYFLKKKSEVHTKAVSS